MKRLLYLAALSAAATLMLTSVALGQDDTATGGGICPEGQFPATAPGDPGEGSLVCFDTQEEANFYSETGRVLGTEPPAAGDPGAGEGQYERQYEDEPPVAPEDETQPPATPEAGTPLPATGGPALLLPAAGLLAATSLVALTTVRRRP